MPLFAVWNRKIDLIEGHRVSVICNDGRVYEGFGTVPCIGEDENGEETDAILPYEMIWKRKWEVSL